MSTPVATAEPNITKPPENQRLLRLGDRITIGVCLALIISGILLLGNHISLLESFQQQQRTNLGESIGKVTKMEGVLRRNSKTHSGFKSLQNAAPLYSGDTIMTQADSSASIELGSDIKIDLPSNVMLRLIFNKPAADSSPTESEEAAVPHIDLITGEAEFKTKSAALVVTKKNTTLIIASGKTAKIQVTHSAAEFKAKAVSQKAQAKLIAQALKKLSSETKPGNPANQGQQEVFELSELVEIKPQDLAPSLDDNSSTNPKNPTQPQNKTDALADLFTGIPKPIVAPPKPLPPTPLPPPKPPEPVIVKKQKPVIIKPKKPMPPAPPPLPKPLPPPPKPAPARAPQSIKPVRKAKPKPVEDPDDRPTETPLTFIKDI